MKPFRVVFLLIPRCDTVNKQICGEKEPDPSSLASVLLHSRVNVTLSPPDQRR